MGASPTVEHVMWDCPGYQSLQQQHLPQDIQTFLDWTTLGNDGRAHNTLLSL
ncbi:hypothetical protein IscW_ISCW005725 [Ixodes scapularis]|uniref:Uncharacterized protein n=1 Tax=Ixodes scapularis TaxID=6945 RepID=B7PQ28_IXOSC|nr:hypothetical protein IscW_ISCW005725 [Ixodes scapularis]|eukprot:XP_002435870.1 hypothetical protein IscW_ISCW005725 [Ixodes scapularis]